MVYLGMGDVRSLSYYNYLTSCSERCRFLTLLQELLGGYRGL